MTATHAPSTPTVPAAPSAQTRGARLAAELTTEAAGTRRVLERLPEDRLDWRPHPKSMTLGQLALHLAQLPLGIASLVEPDVAELPIVPLTQPASRAEIVEALDRSLAHAHERLARWSDADLDAPWSLTHAGTVLLTMPRGELLRTLLFNHGYHHRGQLTVYLRLLDVPVPSLYGPTADERLFG